MEHPVAWSAPQPFWRPGTAAAAARGAIAQPQILRFANDEFIEEMLATLERDPRLLPSYTAQPEDWRNPMVGPNFDPSKWIEREPARLLPLIRKYKARAGLPALPQPVPLRPLKLYQPAHQRHYLVAGSLVCQAQGLPDRAIDPARQRVSFVIRRLMLKTPTTQPSDPLPSITDKSLWDEYAWVLAGKEGEWRPVGDAAIETGLTRLISGEERLSMFPARYAEAAGHPRRLFVGSVPVGRRETYQGGLKRDVVPSDEQLAEQQATQARTVQFQADALGPWRALVPTARDLDGWIPLSVLHQDAFNDDGSLKTEVHRESITINFVDTELLSQLRSRLQLSSWYLLLDFRHYLQRYLPGYLAWVDGGESGAPPEGLADFHAALKLVSTPQDMEDGDLAILAGTSFGVGDLADDLPDALRRIAPFDALLEGALSGVVGYATKPFDLTPTSPDELDRWPDFLFLFADPVYDVPPPTNALPNSDQDYATEKLQARIDALVDLLPTDQLATTSPPPEPTLAAMQPADMREAWYVMRLAYERPDCAPFEGTVVSRATVPFQMAGFFDPDAPARPIRIGLPMDISPAGLRKFDKNAVFMMSDMLCGHIDRFKGITLADIVLSVLPWPFHKSLSVPDKGPCKEGSTPLGVMCSLSIPIVTICALILLMIIVSLLDFIFRWLPLFVICFPLPGFKAKK